MRTLTYLVKGQDRQVHVSSGLVTKALDNWPEQPYHVIIDTAVYSQNPQLSILHKRSCRSLTLLKGGESLKTWAQAHKLIERLLSLGVTRDMALVAIGGGTLGDMVGFVASLILRGIPWIYVPTTLLAQVDASFGGKTAINSREGKNLIGSFHFPTAVYCDPLFLSTLPERHWRAGYVELLKHALIAEADLFSWLDQRDLYDHPDLWAEAIFKSLQLKQRIIGEDWFEEAEGTRQVLNLGHTFGHAIEAATGYKYWLHGEAVSVGIVLAFEMATHLDLCDRGEGDKVRQHLQDRHLPIDLSPGLREKAYPYIYKDKKRCSDSLTFILPEKIGKMRVHKVKDLELERVVNHNYIITY